MEKKSFEEETLLCDFHVHTNHSDGKLPMAEVVDLFGRSGHDAIAITDHITDTQGWLGRAATALRRTVTPGGAKAYFEEIASEAARAWAKYRMLVIPGAEITHNALTRDRSCHILALGITEFLSADRSPLQILREIRRRGAVSVACHPHEVKELFANTFYLWNRRRRLARHIDRWEVANRWDLFPAVSREKFPSIATGDFHSEEHLYTWKTLVRSRRDPGSVLAALRSPVPFAITQLQPPAEPAAAWSGVPAFA
ncbi:MAG: PHP domain-containing protein [Thermoanaerobaculia bacterium]